MLRHQRLQVLRRDDSGKPLDTHHKPLNLRPISQLGTVLVAHYNRGKVA